MSKFLVYKDLLVSWNKKMNLTALTDDRQIIIKHFADSLTASPYIGESSSVVDVGTGAGFPGVPLKIVKPGISLALLDSLNKRTVFLRELSDKLNLDFQIINNRAENAAHDAALREAFDVAVSRAVAPLSILAEYCLPFVKCGGVFLAMKSGNVREEIDAAGYAVELLGGALRRADSITLEGIGRTIIVIEKTKSTSAKYPRKAGIPSKRPLSVEKRK